MTSYVGNQQHRVIWFKANQTAFLLLFDRHDEAYRRAVKRRVDLDGEDGVRVVELQAADPSEPPWRRARDACAPGPFDPWDDALLVAAGFAPHEINLLREARDDDGVLALQRYLAPASFELALQVALAASEDEVRALAAPAQRLRSRRRTRRSSPSRLKSVCSPAPAGAWRCSAASDIESVLTRPIEDWMVFLHPDQRRLVDRRFNGPARITGGAGTGKTVVGVHRAARLAGDGRKVLFTTYIRTLPEGLRDALSATGA